MQLTAGVSPGRAGEFGGETTIDNFRGRFTFNANGLRSTTNNFILDGVDNNANLFNAGGVVIAPVVDAIEAQLKSGSSPILSLPRLPKSGECHAPRTRSASRDEPSKSVMTRSFREQATIVMDPAGDVGAETAIKEAGSHHGMLVSFSSLARKHVGHVRVWQKQNRPWTELAIRFRAVKLSSGSVTRLPAMQWAALNRPKAMPAKVAAALPDSSSPGSRGNGYEVVRKPLSRGTGAWVLRGWRGRAITGASSTSPWL